MITNWKVTGDTHGNMKRFENLPASFDMETLGIIILGDAGCNYYKNKKDHWTKMSLEKIGCMFYCVRGNHEERPENIKTMQTMYDEDVAGEVYYEPDYPHIHYFKDGGVYTIGGHKTLVIGGAYSVDKFYRLQMGYMWFPQEQLTADEMKKIESEAFGEKFDFVFTHTCPISWEPRDLFLNGINQSEVDKSMELWLDDLKDEINWTVWLFGHYHADRLERPGVEMFFTDIDDLDVIWGRWTSGEELSWWLEKSPMFYEGE